MKKKLKLGLSIACMCITFAILCFGVYSAVSVTYTISGTVSYQVVDCLINVNTSVYKYTDGLLTEDQAKGMFTTCKSLEKVENSDFSFSTANDEDFGVDDIEKTQELNLEFDNCYAFFIVVSVGVINEDQGVLCDVDLWLDDEENVWYYVPPTSHLKKRDGVNDIIVVIGMYDKTSSFTYSYESYFYFELADESSIEETGNVTLSVMDSEKINDTFNTISQTNDTETFACSVENSSMEALNYSNYNLRLAYVNFAAESFSEVLNTKINILNAKLDGVANSNIQYLNVENANVKSTSDLYSLLQSGDISLSDITSTPEVLSFNLSTSGTNMAAIVIGVPASISFTKLTFDTILSLAERDWTILDEPDEYRYSFSIVDDKSIAVGLRTNEYADRQFESYELSDTFSYSIFEPEDDYLDLLIDMSSGFDENLLNQYIDVPAIYLQLARLLFFYSSYDFIPIPEDDSADIEYNGETITLTKSNWNDYYDTWLRDFDGDKETYDQLESVCMWDLSDYVTIPFAKKINISTWFNSGDVTISLLVGKICFDGLIDDNKLWSWGLCVGRDADAVISGNGQGTLSTYTDLAYQILHESDTTSTKYTSLTSLGLSSTSSWGDIMYMLLNYIKSNGASGIVNILGEWNSLNKEVDYQIHFVVPGEDYTFSGLNGLVFPSNYSTKVMKVNGDVNNFNVNFWDAESIVSNDSSATVVDNMLITSSTKTLLKYASQSSKFTVTLPDYIAKIGSGAFYNCQNLTSLVIPYNSITSFGEYDLQQTGIDEIYIHSTYLKQDDFRKTIIISDISEVKGLGKSLLVWNDIEDLIISTGKNVTVTYEDNISNLKFELTSSGYIVSGMNDTSLTDIVVPETYIPSGGTKMDVVGIKASAFQNNTTLVNVMLPNTITSIGDNAFKGCTNIKLLELDNMALSSIGVNNISSTMVVTAKNSTTIATIKQAYDKAIDINLDFDVHRTRLSGNVNQNSTGNDTNHVDYVLTVEDDVYTFSHDFYYTLDYVNNAIFIPTANENVNVKLQAYLSATIYLDKYIDHVQEQIALQRTSDSAVLFGTSTDETYVNHSSVPISVSYETADGSKANAGDSLKLKIYFEIMEGVQCFTGETLVTMADGSTKQIKDVTYDDLLMVYDFDRGEFSASYPIWIAEVGEYDHYYKMSFSDGSYVNIVLSHRLFTLTDMDFEKSIDATYSSIGKEFVKQVLDENGKPKFISVTCTDIERINETVEYYNMVTSQSLNFLSNGFLGATGIANLYHFEKNENGNIVHNQSELATCKAGTTDWSTGTQFAFDVYNQERITEEIYTAYRLSEIRNMADCLINDPTSPYYALAQKYGKNVVLKKAIEVVDDYFKDGYINSLRSTSEKLKITMSDRILDLKVDYKSTYTLPEANVTENFVGWYNTYDGKIYQAGESAEIHMNTHFIARYSN